MRGYSRLTKMASPMVRFDLVDSDQLAGLSALSGESRDVVVVGTFFEPQDKRMPIPPANYKLTDESVRLLEESIRILKFGGLLFVYGLPHHLAFWGRYLSSIRADGVRMIFKYWIALDIDDAPRGVTLQPAHHGLLMFLKSDDNGSPRQFRLNNSNVRAPHAYCTACGLNLKDWGGKKHLMNPLGTALSDVWRDLPKIEIRDHIVPDFVLNRIKALTGSAGATYLHIVQNNPGLAVDSSASSFIESIPPSPSGEWDALSSL